MRILPCTTGSRDGAPPSRSRRRATVPSSRLRHQPSPRGYTASHERAQPASHGRSNPARNSRPLVTRSVRDLPEPRIVRRLPDSRAAVPGRAAAADGAPAGAVLRPGPRGPARRGACRTGRFHWCTRGRPGLGAQRHHGGQRSAPLAELRAGRRVAHHRSRVQRLPQRAGLRRPACRSPGRGGDACRFPSPAATRCFKP